MLKKNIIINLITLLFLNQYLLAFTTDHEIQLLKLKSFISELDSINQASYQKITKFQTVLDDYHNKNFDISDSTRGYLDYNKLYTPFQLHQPMALAHMFKLLVRAINQSNSSEAELWIACISHNVNDSLSWFQEPHIRYYKEHLISFNNDFLIKKAIPKDILISNRKIFSLSLTELYNRNSIRPIINKFIKTYKPKLLGNSIEEVLNELIKIPYQLREFRNSQLPHLFNSINDRIFGGTSNPKKAYNAQLKIGEKGIKATANIIATAFQLARDNISINIDKSPIIESLKDTQINILNKQNHNYKNEYFNEPAYVILTEGEKFNETVFGDLSKLYVSTIINYFKDKKLPYYVMDINELNQTTELDPKKHKMLIIPALYYNKTINIDSKKINEKIQKFSQTSSIIWLGGFKRPYMLPKLSNALQYTKKDINLSSSVTLKRTTFYHSYEGKKNIIFDNTYHFTKKLPKSFKIIGYTVAHKELPDNVKTLITINKPSRPIYQNTLCIQAGNNLIFSQLYPFFPNTNDEEIGTFFPFRWDLNNVAKFNILLDSITSKIKE